MSEKDNKRKKSDESKWNEEDRTKLDDLKEQQFVDDIPLEDLKLEQEEEKNKHKTKNDSQSERKFMTESSKRDED